MVVIEYRLLFRIPTLYQHDSWNVYSMGTLFQLLLFYLCCEMLGKEGKEGS